MRNNVGLGIAMGTMAVGLLVFWGARALPERAPAVEQQAPALELRPAETERGRQALRRRAAWVRRSALTSAELRATHVPVGDPRVRVHGLSRRPVVPASSFLPNAAEAPWPRGETVRSLHELLAIEARGDDATAALAAFMASAKRARLDPTRLQVAHDPWRAVVVLEVERRRALSVSSAEQAPAVGRWMLRLADELQRIHPGTPVADYAWLYRLDAVGGPQWDTFDAARAGQLGVQALQTSSDRLVSAVATDRVEQAASSDPRLLPQLEELWQRGQTDVWFVSASVDHALANAQWDRAAEWLTRLERAVQGRCRPPAGTNDTPVIQKPSCQAWSQDLTWAWAQVRAVQGTDASTWREQVPLAAWRCHLWGSERASGSRVQVSGQFDGERWSWSGWRGADLDFDACFEAEMYFGARPDGVVSLDVVVARD